MVSPGKVCLLLAVVERSTCLQPAVPVHRGRMGGVASWAQVGCAMVVCVPLPLAYVLCEHLCTLQEHDDHADV